jgi:hypothetical protein
MKDLWAVTVRANWHVTFRFEEGEACDVDLVDYHEEETSYAYEEPTPSRPHCSARVHYTARPVRECSRTRARRGAADSEQSGQREVRYFP